MKLFLWFLRRTFIDMFGVFWVFSAVLNIIVGQYIIGIIYLLVPFSLFGAFISGINCMFNRTMPKDIYKEFYAPHSKRDHLYVVCDANGDCRGVFSSKERANQVAKYVGANFSSQRVDHSS